MSTRRSLRRTILVAAAVAAVWICWSLGSGYLLGAATRAGERRLARIAAEHGVEVLAVSHRAVGLRWPASIRWEGLSLQGRVFGGGSPLLRDGFALGVDSATVTLESFGDREISVSLAGLLLTTREGARPEHAPGAPWIESLSGSAFSVRAPLDLLRPAKAASQLREILSDLRQLARTGRCALPVAFEGTVSFPFRGTTTTRIRVVREGAESVLTMDEEDLLALSGRLGLKLPLTHHEVTLLARHPLRVPRLLALRDAARAQAEQERNRDGSFPEDAYRHVLWSYTLVKTFGERFAAQVTDAHERGITGNTEAERLMDLSNNNLGRWYARIGVPAAQLAERVRSDRRVIRNPGEVGQKTLFGD